MSEDVSSDIIKKTQKYLGKYVKKPALTEKLLKKPPFRFLHDVIGAVIKETGFLKGLYSEKELISDNVKDKEAKVAFLTKLIEAVKTLTKTNLKAKPSKIVAGLEPAETNILLQTIAKAVDKKIDSNEYVNKLKSGEIAAATETKKSKKVDVKNPKENVKQDKQAKETRKKATPTETPKSTDRSKSKVRTKEESKDKQEPKTKSRTRRESKEKIETRETKKDEKISKQRSTEINNSDLDNQASNIASNLNEDLKNSTQELTNDTSTENNHINDSLLNNREAAVGESSNEVPNALTNDDNAGIQHERQHTEDIHEDKNNDAREEEIKIERRPTSSLVRPKSARPKSGETKHHKVLPPAVITNENVASEPVKATRPSSSLRPPSVRPPSGRPGAPRLRPDSALAAADEGQPVQMGRINVIVENFDARRPDGERAEDNDDDDDEDGNTVVVREAPDPEAARDDGNDDADVMMDVPLENRGRLVDQILEQIGEGAADGRRPKIEIDWDGDTFRSKDAAAKELKELRALIQTLTKTANPLGKLLNYLNEDIDAMHNELETWTNTKRQLLREITQQKRISEEASQPLLHQLETLSHDIKKQDREILNVRSNILRNEMRIKELVTK